MDDREIKVFCCHCKDYFTWCNNLNLKVGDMYRCPKCFGGNILEARPYVEKITENHNFRPYIEVHKTLDLYNEKAYLRVRIDFDDKSFYSVVEVQENKIDLFEEFGELLKLIGGEFKKCST